MSKSWNRLRKRLQDGLAPHGAVSEFCRKANFGRNTVDRWLKNQSSPNIENIDAIAEGLDTEAWKLLYPEGESFPAINQVQKSIDQALTDAANKLEQIRKTEARKVALSEPSELYDEVCEMILRLDSHSRENFLIMTRSLLRKALSDPSTKKNSKLG